MEQICDFSICSGCGVCSSVCPKQCISFEEGKKGHLFPKIDTSLCIDCKKCVRTCPALKEHPGIMPTHAFAAFARDKDDYLTTNSGGAAQVLSLQILAENGVVYGCAALPGADIRHIRVETVEELNLLKGSKYVQSNVRGVYKEIIKDIKSGRQVLFVGTPCQTAAVSALFSKNPDNLLLVDLICHGVPSKKYLHTYLSRHVPDIKEIQTLRFRTTRGYQITAAKLRPGSQEEILYKSVPLSENAYGDDYCSPFFFGFISRPSCYTCQYAKPQRSSDITIGDFWGLGKMEPQPDLPDHTKGISVILPITEKGYRIFEKIKDKLYIDERPVKEAINGNHQLQHPAKHTRRMTLYEHLCPFLGTTRAYRLVNIDKPVRKALRPYFHKLKQKLK